MGASTVFEYEPEIGEDIVETAGQARALRFVSSPTVRVGGRDIALELRESACGSEACSCDGEPIACRVWSYRGDELTEAPVGLIVDAILTELYGGVVHQQPAPTEAYELPENLGAFFEGKSVESIESSCCGPAERASCCEPSAKADCCGASTSGGCGCR